MDRQAERTRRRRVQGELTDRQRRVLDLLAAGKTNGEIADVFGITLDGAKYHVREVCDRVGVDTREEAAEWWRQQHGMRARFEVLRDRVGGMPAFVRWGLAGGAAVAVAVVTAFALWPQGDEQEGLDAGVWVALAVPVEGVSETNQLAQLRLVNPGTSEEMDVGEPAEWVGVALAPDGSHLYALEMRPTGDALVAYTHLFDVDADQSVETRWEHPSGSVPVWVKWSPDSTRVSVATGNFAGVLMLDGTVQGFDVSEFTAGGRMGDDTAWAPDSSMFAYHYTSNLLVVVDRDGERIAQLEGENLWPPEMADAPERRQIMVLGWPSVRDVEATVLTTGESADDLQAWTLEGVFDSGDFAWTGAARLTGSELDAALGANQDAFQRLRDDHGITSGTLEQPARTFFGATYVGALVWEEPTPVSLPVETTFVSMIDGERFVYPLGTMTRRYSVGFPWDIVKVE